MFYILYQFSSHIPSIIALLLFFCCLTRWRKSNYTRKHPPQPSGSWPIIGHLRLLGLLPHISLGEMADKYGPIFMIKLGIQRALVISSPTMAKECLGINDGVFMDRPQTIFVEHMAYKSAMLGFSKYNTYWRDMRKIIHVELLSRQKVEQLKDTRISEIRSAIKDMYAGYSVDKNRKTMDMENWFNDVALNSTVKLFAGKSVKEMYQGEKYNKISKLFESFKLADIHIPADAFPFLRRFDFGGHEKSMKNVAKEMDQVLQNWLEEHKKRKVFKEGKEKDFMDVMLNLFEKGHIKPAKFEPDTIIKASCMAVLMGSTYTMVKTLKSVLSLLLNNKDVMKKVQTEIDATVGTNRRLKESDLKNLLYLDAVIKETMRLYPPGPIPVPRQTVKDCTVNSYHIPAGTQLYVNLYKIQRDPQLWSNPSEFHPERFLTTHKDYNFRGTNYAFIPFGAGRRMCPGITLAYKSMMMTLGSLLHGFEISTPSDETVKFRLPNMKANPLNVTLVPRLLNSVYNPPEIVT